MILILKYIIPKGFVGLAFFPFIVLKRKELKTDVVLINHEKIHLRQQLELLLVLFYLLYIAEWMVKVCWYRSTSLAYKNLSFEREAYAHEHDLYYLETRKPWAFIAYL
ncbi:conserved hypothetical protein [Tenacibaculum litopenaei]|uniref:hypothetical protein n=1 Tax=Tenacibaculum litopenaei TaxID=396016 RepID=UPI003894C81E